MKAIILLATCGFAACAAMDRTALSEFEPEADGTFVFKARTDPIYSLRDGEATRIAWLGEYLRSNGMCPNGHEITERQVVNVRDDIVQIHDVIYRGRCTD